VRFYESRGVRLPPATHQSSRTRGHFPDDDSALKLLRLIARDLTTTRGGVAGTGTQGWKEALNTFEIYFPGRLRIC
jgi:transposase-like protein